MSFQTEGKDKAGLFRPGERRVCHYEPFAFVILTLNEVKGKDLNFAQVNSAWQSLSVKCQITKSKIQTKSKLLNSKTTFFGI